MIHVDKAILKFLLAGRAIDAHTDRELTVGRVYAVGEPGARKRTCNAEVTACTPAGDGFQLRLRMPAYREKPHYLTANPAASRADYTENPARAAREPDGSAVEAVDVGGKWLARVSAAAASRDDISRRERAHLARMAAQGRQPARPLGTMPAAQPAQPISWAAGPTIGASFATPGTVVA